MKLYSQVMKTLKSVAMVAVVAGIGGSSAYAAVQVSGAHGTEGFALVGFLLIGLSSILRRRSGRSL